MSDKRDDHVSTAPPGAVDPIAMARRDLKKALPRRFYRDVSIAPAEDGFGIFLDGKTVRTPAKALLIVPTAPLAEALAAEWRQQAEIIEPDSMPLTRLVNSAIDGVAHQIAATVTEIAKFAETDLVCYRAGDPPALVEAQAAAWDPILVFARDELGARFICVEGVMFAAQPEAALAAVRRAIDEVADGADGALQLAALSVMTSLTGSALLSLAVAKAHISPEAAWAAAHIDEDYQIRLWGTDDEAMQRRARRWRDMEAAARVFM